MPFGDKVPVGPSLSLVAGNAANNSVGAARLGLKTAIYTNIGKKDDDESDLRIIEKLKKEKVDTRYIFEDKNLPNSHHIVLDFKGERTILTHHESWRYNLPDLEKSKWVYLTSLSPSFTDSNIIAQLISYIERSSAKLFFNPGTFQIKAGARKNAHLFSICEVLIVNKEEAKLLLGFDEGEKVPVKKLLKGLADLGIKTVVITDGRDGSFGSDGEKLYSIDAYPSKIVEMTGAGDAYASGTLAALFHGNSLPDAMRWGSANGASVVEQIGAQAGLLSYSKMQEKLKEHSRIFAKEI